MEEREFPQVTKKLVRVELHRILKPLVSLSLSLLKNEVEKADLSRCSVSDLLTVFLLFFLLTHLIL